MKSGLSKTNEWQKLSTLAETVSSFTLSEAFEKDGQRFNRFSLESGHLFLDYSKHLVNDEIRLALVDLARAANLEAARDQLFAGEKVNTTENRPALHTALRDRDFTPLQVNGRDIMPDIKSVHQKMRILTEQIRNKQWLGFGGKVICDVVNIGIGGSHLGPEMACHALRDFHSSHLGFHFVSNVDYTHINEVMSRLDPETTLFIISSKSFTTQETLTNANEAKHWILAHFGDEEAIARHFLSVSSKPEAAVAFGIAEQNVLPMWDWVGGRYSLWSAVGLPLALAIGMPQFEQFLAGAQQMDVHFQQAALDENMPVIMALLGVWYNNFLGIQSQAIVPYSEHLSLFMSYMQQCDMESNGKSVSIDGLALTKATGPVIWGGAGTNSQHAFFQLLHQGTQVVPIDFIGVVKCHHQNIAQHKILLANLLAQTEALMMGKSPGTAYLEMINSGMDSESANALKSHRASPGNRPSTTLLMNELNPYSLGQLIALYEHKVFCQGVIWQVNSYDQWGVEFGKQLGKPILKELMDAEISLDHDGSTNALLRRIRASLSS
jgi:glucose-6-phosphate isomerase